MTGIKIAFALAASLYATATGPTSASQDARLVRLYLEIGTLAVQDPAAGATSEEIKKTILQSVKRAVRFVDRPEDAELSIRVRGKRENQEVAGRQVTLNDIVVELQPALTPRPIQMVIEGSWRDAVRHVGREIALIIYQIHDQLLPAAAGLDDQQIVKTALARLKDRDPVIRAGAASELGQRRAFAQTAIPALLDLLRDGAPLRVIAGRPTTVGGEAARAVIALGETERVLSVLRTARDPQSRQSAVIAFGTPDLAGNEAVESAVRDALRDADWRVRREAAERMDLLLGIRAVEPLIESLGDRVESVSFAAHRSLLRLTGVEPPLGPDKAAWQSWWATNRARFKRGLPRQRRQD